MFVVCVASPRFVMALLWNYTWCKIAEKSHLGKDRIAVAQRIIAYLRQNYTLRQ